MNTPLQDFNIKGLVELMKEYTGEDEVVELEQLLAEIKERRGAPKKFSTGFASLEGLTDGFSGGNLVIVSGPSGQGKTTFCKTLTEGFDKNIVWFTFEMPEDEFAASLKKTAHIYVPKRLEPYSMSFLVNKVAEAVAKYHCEIVFIDHLHYLVDLRRLGQTQSISLEIGMVVRMLKRLAIETDILIFLVAHTTKSLHEGVPSLEDVRDSGLTVAESDFVLFITRKREKQGKNDLPDEGIRYKNESLVSLQKNRRTGRLGSFSLMCADGKFYEKDTQYFGANEEGAILPSEIPF